MSTAEPLGCTRPPLDLINCTSSGAILLDSCSLETRQPRDLCSTSPNMHPYKLLSIAWSLAAYMDLVATEYMAAIVVIFPRHLKFPSGRFMACLEARRDGLIVTVRY